MLVLIKLPIAGMDNSFGSRDSLRRLRFVDRSTNLWCTLHDNERRGTEKNIEVIHTVFLVEV